MNKLTISLQSLNIGGFILGLTLSDIYTILGIISFLISIISGVIVIVLKLKMAMQDGVLTKEEIKDIEDSLEKIKQDVEKKKED